MVRCVKEKTFPLSSIIKQPEMNSSQWSSYMATVYYGMCHTFRNTKKIGANYYGGQFFLDPNITYKVIIHDPQFYLIVPGSLVFPRIWLDLKAGQKAGYLNYFDITLTQRHLLNRPEKPCEKEEDYDFLQCVKTSQARLVGCRPPWDIWSPHTIPLCQTKDQLKEYEEIDAGLFTIRKKKKFLEKTGCKVPCNYKVCVRLEFSLKYEIISQRNTK